MVPGCDSKIMEAQLGPLREGKGTTFEGGQRVPCVMWAPGRIPAGTECADLIGTIDMLPTIAAITGVPLPEGQKNRWSRCFYSNQRQRHFTQG